MSDVLAWFFFADYTWSPLGIVSAIVVGASLSSALRRHKDRNA